jgi:hypothetical protein
MSFQELELARRIYSGPSGDRTTREQHGAIMNAKILAGAAALALTTTLVTAPVSAQNWGCHNGCYPTYGYAPAYNYAPLYDNYRGSYDGRWSYRGGPHPSSGHL